MFIEDNGKYKSFIKASYHNERLKPQFKKKDTNDLRLVIPISLSKNPESSSNFSPHSKFEEMSPNSTFKRRKNVLLPL
jgi:hypothetical protein